MDDERRSVVDRKIATWMGWRREEDGPAGQPRWWIHPDNDALRRPQIPDYTRDRAASEEVLEKIIQPYGYYVRYLFQRPDGVWTIKLVHAKTAQYIHIIAAATLAEAIALAAEQVIDAGILRAGASDGG